MFSIKILVSTTSTSANDIDAILRLKASSSTPFTAPEASSGALLHRSRAIACVVPRGDADPCQAGSSASSVFRNFSTLQCNIRGYITNRAQLDGQLSFLPAKPVLVCLNETWLDGSLENIELGDYILISRRDRADGRRGRGIALFALLSCLA